MVRRAKAKRKQKEAEEAAAKQRTVNISAIHIINMYISNSHKILSLQTSHSLHILAGEKQRI